MFSDKNGLLSVTLSVIISFLFVATIVTAATTINENINTAGTLTVTGASALATTTISTDLTVDTNTFYVDSVNGRVGVGDNSPEALLDVGGKFKVDIIDIYSGTGSATQGAPRLFLGTNASSGDDSAILIGRNLVGDSLFSHAIRDESVFSSGPTTGAYSSFDSAPTIIGSMEPYNHFTSFQSRAVYNGTGSINHMAGFTSFLYGSGHIKTGVGLEIYDSNVTGTLDNYYGIYINPITEGTSKFAIYSAGDVPSYHEGFWQTGADITAAGVLRGSNFYSANASNSTYIGIGAVPSDGYFVTSIGHNAGHSITGSAQHDTLIGTRAGYSLSTGDYNTLIGSYSGDNLTTGSNNIIIGYNIDTPAVDTSYFLNIGNLIYGDLSSGNVGIGTTSPATKLDVNGIIKTQPASFRTCDANAQGGIMYDSDDNHFYGCNGSAWVQLDN